MSGSMQCMYVLACVCTYIEAIHIRMYAAACPQAMYGNRYGALLIQSDVHTVYLWHLFNGFIVQPHFSYHTNFIEKHGDFTEAVIRVL